MYKQTLAALFVLTSVVGCAATPENPVDHVTFRHEPLVKQVEDGMTKQQVLTIGGPPSTEIQRTDGAGTCNNYVLNRDGHEQVYFVTFDRNDRVEDKGFLTCEQHATNNKETRI